MELTIDLARELELAEAGAAVECAEMAKLTQSGDFAVEPIAGGFAVYCGPDSPVTQAVGLGLHGAVREEEFDRLEDFYFTRREAVRVETCPMADATLVNLYKQRGYCVSEFSNVMIERVGSAAREQAPAGVEVRRARQDELDLWAVTVSRGFAEGQPAPQGIVSIMKMFAQVRGTECYLASTDGRIVGGATLALRGRIAGLFGASTLPEFRKRGVQTALLRRRLDRAKELGCELAMSIAVPGSVSQRNMARVGFQTLYTRVKFERAYRPESKRAGASAAAPDACE
jgi:GNAT superfamily N-acetyltransferase